MSLRELCQDRFLHQMVGSCRQAIELSRKTQAGGAFCAMIVDEATLRYLSSACKVYDILEAGVSVIESITKSRQPLPELDAIYFLSPNAQSVEALVKDFKNEKKPQHRSVHVFWSTTMSLDHEIMKPLITPPLLSRIKTFVDFNLAFVAYESRAFHLDMPHALLKLFPGGKDNDEQLLQSVAYKLATVCLSLGDKPNIRFQQTRRGLNEKIAQLVQYYTSKVKPEGVSRGQTELIIVDRSIDATSLLVHEYTYQALAYDVLAIPCCTPASERLKQGTEEAPPDDTYQFMDRKEVKTLLLGEHDDVYVKYRHQHITVVIRGVSDELRKFSRDNAAAQYAAAGGKKATEKDIASAIRGLPQYREMLAKFWAHITLSDACFNALQNKGVFKAGYLEQDLATGVDKDGKLVQVMQCLSVLGTMVAEKSGVQTQEKTRLLLLYFVTMDGVQEDDKKKMMGAAGLSLDMVTIINNFLALGLHNAEEDPDHAKPSSVKHTHKMHSDDEKVQFFQRKAKSSEYTLSRFEPAVKDLMERAASRRLPRSKFPYLQDPEARQIGTQPARFGAADDDEHRSAGGLRAAHFDWDWGNGQDSTTSKATNKKLEQKVMQSKDKIVIFITGGITMSEIRTAYDVSRITGADIYIGGTSIITPPGLFEALRRPMDELSP